MIIQDKKIYVNGEETRNPELIGLALLDALEDNKIVLLLEENGIEPSKEAC
ncbi:hypothetical protein [Tenacibaculum sp. 190524A05c]|uniref:hypothetical protein n=1 Tax=Tenacibaculum platacis TaxID=3137852 RepID=UPI0031FB4AE7